MGSLVASGQSDRHYDKRAHVAEFQRRVRTNIEQHAPYPNHAPQVALAFTPLASITFEQSLLVFSVLSAATYALAAWLLVIACPALGPHRLTFAVLAAACPLMLTTLRFGQITPVALLAAALAVRGLGQGRKITAGFALGLLAAKPTWVVVLVPALILARDWRTVVGMVISVVGQFVVGLMTVGPHGLMTYVNVLQHLAEHPDLVVLNPAVSHSARGFMRLAGVPAAAANTVSVMMLIMTMPVAVICWRSEATPAMRVGYLLLLTLLVSPHVMTYDLLLAAVFIVALASQLVTMPVTRWTSSTEVLLALLYVSSFSVIVALFTRVQLSTLVITALAALTYPLATARREQSRVATV
jgi:hypothetical protein